MKTDILDDGTVYKIPESTEGTKPFYVIRKKSPKLRETITFKITAFLWVWAFIQFIVAPYVGYSIGSPEWEAIFAFSSENITYYWTWFTSMVSHGNFIHLLVNSIVLLSFGRFVEIDIGKVRMVGFFIIAGLIAGLTQVGVVTVFSTEPMAIVGASGAISGLIGYLTLRKPEQAVYLFFIVKMKLRTASILFFGGSIIVVALFGFGAGGFGHTAHISGFVVGFVYAILRLKTN